MKKQFFRIVCAIAFVSVVAFAYYNQCEQIKSGDLIVLSSVENVFGGPVFVDRITRTITSKEFVFPIKLWEDESGNVFSRRDTIAYRAHLAVDLPTTDAETKLYRTYFPRRS